MNRVSRSGGLTGQPSRGWGGGHERPPESGRPSGSASCVTAHLQVGTRRRRRAGRRRLHPPRTGLGTAPIRRLVRRPRRGPEGEPVPVAAEGSDDDLLCTPASPSRGTRRPERRSRSGRRAAPWSRPRSRRPIPTLAGSSSWTSPPSTPGTRRTRSFAGTHETRTTGSTSGAAPGTCGSSSTGSCSPRLRRPALVFETNLATRYYLPREDVQVELEPSDTRTICAYKGEASYW